MKQGGAISVGTGAVVEKGLGTAIGSYATTQGISGVAIGTGALSSGNTALAVGRQSAATADFSQAIGNVAAATGKGSLAIGHPQRQKVTVQLQLVHQISKTLTQLRGKLVLLINLKWQQKQPVKTRLLLVVAQWPLRKML